MVTSKSASIQGRDRKNFLRGRSQSQRFFSRREMLFPGRKFPFLVDQKHILVVSKSHYFVTFPPSIFNFPSSLLQFSFFSSQFSPIFPFFLPSFFLVGQQKFLGQKSLVGTLPPLPPHVTPIASIIKYST